MVGLVANGGHVVVGRQRKVDSSRKVCAYQYIGLSFILPKSVQWLSLIARDDDDDADFGSNFDNAREEEELLLELCSSW